MTWIFIIYLGYRKDLSKFYHGDFRRRNYCSSKGKDCGTGWTNNNRFDLFSISSMMTEFKKPNIARVPRWNKYMIWYHQIFPGENNIIEEMVEIINEPGREGPEGTVQVILSSSVSISWTIFMWLETFQCDKWMNNISPSVLISKRDWQSLTESTVARNCCCN